MVLLFSIFIVIYSNVVLALGFGSSGFWSTMIDFIHTLLNFLYLFLCIMYSYLYCWFSMSKTIFMTEITYLIQVLILTYVFGFRSSRFRTDFPNFFALFVFLTFQCLFIELDLGESSQSFVLQTF